MEVEKKLSEIVTDRCLNVKALASKAEINYQALARCLRCEQELKADDFLAVCRVAGIDPNEFLTAL